LLKNLGKATEPKDSWFSSFFPNAKRVYENHARLWLGLKQLSHLPGHKLPVNIRNLIENAYDKEADIPSGLVKSDINADGIEQSHRTMGLFNTIDFEIGYTMNNQQWPEDLRMTTAS
jgi:CRISPR-associated endonuclease/helicase Cas3